MVKIGVTLGDPSGIGPEIVAKSLKSVLRTDARITLIGNRENFEEIARISRIERETFEKVDFVDIPNSGIIFGRVQRVSGEIAVKSIETATKMALSDELDGISTAPINKEAILLAGSKYIDHTIMLAGLTHSSSVTTVFEVNKLRILFLTKHVSLIDACKSIKEESVYDYILLSDQALQSLGIKNGKIAVAALNPHAGENGLFGREEIDEIAPAIKRAQKLLNVSGPFPADSVFNQAAKGRFDIVLSLYHDQGHIAAKMYDFDRTVSMNLGLPFLRTSVDHGTAFDIAGKGIANEVSMIEAIKKALQYSIPYKTFVRDSARKDQ